MQRLRSLFHFGGSAVLVLVGLMGILVAVSAVVGVARRGQVQAYQPVNLMGGATVPTVVIVPTSNPETPPTLQPTDAPVIDGNAHIVQAGETLYGIALQYNLTAEQIAAANGIAVDTAIIYEGQALMIPGGAIPVQQPTAQSTAAAPLTVEQYPPPPLDGGVPTTVNGISVETFAPLPEGVIQHIRNIYAMGQSLGRNPRAFSKLGDSLIENPHFLARFDTGPYNLGNFTYLQPLITYYAGSFGRESVAVRRGLHSWSVLDPMWAGGGCGGGETMLACEFRLQNPSVLFIHLGSNDAGVPESTDRSLREIVEFCMNNGVIPILGTKADRHEGADVNNPIIRKVAADYNVPLWDFDVVAGTLPGRGLDQDGTHMTVFFANDWSSPLAFERGYGIMNLTALMMLDRIWRSVAG
jgi:LysM repeat protein